MASRSTRGYYLLTHLQLPSCHIFANISRRLHAHRLRHTFVFPAHPQAACAAAAETGYHPAQRAGRHARERAYSVQPEAWVHGEKVDREMGREPAREGCRPGSGERMARVMK